MNTYKLKIDEINKYIENFYKGSQVPERGKMYGSIEMLESNWILLDNISSILEGRDSEINYSSFLVSKGYGAKSASLVIIEEGHKNPYEKLNQIWEEYQIWKANYISSSRSITNLRREAQHSIIPPKNR